MVIPQLKVLFLIISFIKIVSIILIIISISKLIYLNVYL